MRNFSEAVTYVLANTNISIKKDLQFPLTFGSAFAKTSVREMELSERSKNILCRNGIQTMQDLMNNFEKIPKFRNCGKTSAKEIKNKFLQRWYETLEDSEVSKFWEEFIIVNS